MPPHPLTNIDIINYYKNEPSFNGAYFRDYQNIVLQKQ